MEETTKAKAEGRRGLLDNDSTTRILVEARRHFSLKTKYQEDWGRASRRG